MFCSLTNGTYRLHEDLSVEFAEPLDERVRRVLMTAATVDTETADDAAGDQYSSTLELLQHLAKISNTLVRIAPSSSSEGMWYTNNLPQCTIHDFVTGAFLSTLDTPSLRDAAAHHVEELAESIGRLSPAISLSERHNIQLRNLGGFHKLCLERLQRHEYLCV